MEHRRRRARAAAGLSIGGAVLLAALWVVHNGYIAFFLLDILDLIGFVHLPFTVMLVLGWVGLLAFLIVGWHWLRRRVAS
jgi:hypothetical protein